MLPKLKSQCILLIRFLIMGILISKLSAGTLGVLTYEIIGGTEFEITDCAYGTAGAVVVPDLIEGLPVTSIDDYAFSYLIDVTSITMPASISSIGNRAFPNCSKLTSVEIPASVTSISRSTFNNCSGSRRRL